MFIGFCWLGQTSRILDGVRYDFHLMTKCSGVSVNITWTLDRDCVGQLIRCIDFMFGQSLVNELVLKGRDTFTGNNSNLFFACGA